MKKILVLIILPLTLLFFPLDTRATTMELTVTINSFTVPERSMIIYNDFRPEDNRPNTEFWLCSKSTISIINKFNGIAGSSILQKAPNSWVGCVAKDSYTTISFDYNGLQPYNVYLEIDVLKQPRGHTIYKADCSSFTRGITDEPWYRSIDVLNYASTSENNDAKCQNYYCDDGDQRCYYSGYIGLNSSYVRGYDYNYTTKKLTSVICGPDSDTTPCQNNKDVDDGVDFYFWRSPSLYTVN